MKLASALLHPLSKSKKQKPTSCPLKLFPKSCKASSKSKSRKLVPYARVSKVYVTKVKLQACNISRSINGGILKETLKI
jgi:hypothetical protein